MDPFHIGHRTSDEQAKIAKALLSRTYQSAPQIVPEGRVPNPAPIIISSKRQNVFSVPENISLKQVTTALEVATDIQQFIQDGGVSGSPLQGQARKSMSRDTITSRLIGGQEALPSGLFDSGNGLSQNRVRTNKTTTRKELAGYLVKSLFDISTPEMILLEMRDYDDNPTFLGQLEEHFIKHFQALAKLKVSDQAKIKFVQVVGLVNRYNYNEKAPPAWWRFDQKVLLMNIEIDGKSLREIARSDGSPTEKVDIEFAVNSVTYVFDAKRWDGVKGTYDAGLKAITGKGIDEMAAAMVKDIRLDLEG